MPKLFPFRGETKRQIPGSGSQTTGDREAEDEVDDDEGEDDEFDFDSFNESDDEC